MMQRSGNMPAGLLLAAWWLLFRGVCVFLFFLSSFAASGTPPPSHASMVWSLPVKVIKIVNLVKHAENKLLHKPSLATNLHFSALSEYMSLTQGFNRARKPLKNLYAAKFVCHHLPFTHSPEQFYDKHKILASPNNMSNVSALCDLSSN